MHAAREKEMWPDVLEAARDLIDRYASNYAVYWYAGEASLQLNQMEAFEKYLTAFVQHAKDDTHYFHAVGLVDAFALPTN
jgi:hypothetical protein